MATPEHRDANSQGLPYNGGMSEGAEIREPLRTPTRLSRAQERAATIENANCLNERFSRSAFAWNDEQLDLIRSLPNPILIDFNNVVVNTGRPWVPNPEAKKALRALTKTGTVFVMTDGERDWNLRQQALENFGLWHPGMVLLVGDNTVIRWQASAMGPIEGGKKGAAVEAAARDYLQFSQTFNRVFNEDELLPKPFMGQTLAPLFKRPYDIPIITVRSLDQHDGAGMHVIPVRAFVGKNDYKIHFGSENLPEQTKENFSLAQATTQIVEYYKNFPTEHAMLVEVSPTGPAMIKSGDKVTEGINYLDLDQLLLLEKEGKTQLRPTTLFAIKEIIRKEAGGALPNELVEALGLAGLYWWILYHPETLSTLFLGEAPRSGGLDSSHDAVVTIKVSRYVDHSQIDRLGTRSRFPDTVFPASISLAGVHQGLGRIIATKFNERLHLEEVQVSLKEGEIDTQYKPDLYHVGSYGHSYSIAPTDEGAGVITEAMVRNVGTDKQVTTINVNGRGLEYYLGDEWDKLERTGYRLAGDSKHLKLITPAWSLTVPTSLQRLSTPDLPWVSWGKRSG